jgi:hypothetical protein
VLEAKRRKMSKQAMREETERLVKEALESKIVTVKQGQTRIETKCGKCGAPNRVSASPGQVRVPYTCKECGEKQKTLRLLIDRRHRRFRRSICASRRAPDLILTNPLCCVGLLG